MIKSRSGKFVLSDLQKSVNVALQLSRISWSSLVSCLIYLWGGEWQTGHLSINMLSWCFVHWSMLIRTKEQLESSVKAWSKSLSAGNTFLLFTSAIILGVIVSTRVSMDIVLHISYDFSLPFPLLWLLKRGGLPKLPLPSRYHIKAPLGSGKETENRTSYAHHCLKIFIELNRFTLPPTNQ